MAFATSSPLTLRWYRSASSAMLSAPTRSSTADHVGRGQQRVGRGAADRLDQDRAADLGDLGCGVARLLTAMSSWSGAGDMVP